MTRVMSAMWSTRAARCLYRLGAELVGDRSPDQGNLRRLGERYTSLRVHVEPQPRQGSRILSQVSLMGGRLPVDASYNLEFEVGLSFSKLYVSRRRG